MIDSRRGERSREPHTTSARRPFDDNSYRRRAPPMWTSQRRPSWPNTVTRCRIRPCAFVGAGVLEPGRRGVTSELDIRRDRSVPSAGHTKDATFIFKRHLKKVDTVAVRRHRRSYLICFLWASTGLDASSLPVYYSVALKDH
jgi:hypothetical protein